MAEQWTCPACGRQFGAVRRPHVCVPQERLEQYLAGLDADQRAIVERVVTHLEDVGPVVVEAVAVGVLVKGRRTFVELRPRRRGMVLSFVLPVAVHHPRVTRRSSTGGATANFVLLTTAADVDEDVEGWLTASHLEHT